MDIVIEGVGVNVATKEGFNDGSNEESDEELGVIDGVGVGVNVETIDGSDEGSSAELGVTEVTEGVVEGSTEV